MDDLDKVIGKIDELWGRECPLRERGWESNCMICAYMKELKEFVVGLK